MSQRAFDMILGGLNSLSEPLNQYMSREEARRQMEAQRARDDAAAQLVGGAIPSMAGDYGAAPWTPPGATLSEPMPSKGPDWNLAGGDPAREMQMALNASESPAWADFYRGESPLSAPSAAPAAPSSKAPGSGWPGNPPAIKTKEDLGAWLEAAKVLKPSGSGQSPELAWAIEQSRSKDRQNAEQGRNTRFGLKLDDTQKQRAIEVWKTKLNDLLQRHLEQGRMDRAKAVMDLRRDVEERLEYQFDTEQDLNAVETYINNAIRLRGLDVQIGTSDAAWLNPAGAARLREEVGAFGNDPVYQQLRTRAEEQLKRGRPTRKSSKSVTRERGAQESEDRLRGNLQKLMDQKRAKQQGQKPQE